MMKGIVQDQNLEKQLEKQMGCMAGFLQIFDRHQMLAGKRLYSTKRLPPSSAVDSALESEKNIATPIKCRELEKPTQNRSAPFQDGQLKSSPAKELRSPILEPVTPAEDETIKPLPIFEFKEGTRSSWKFSRESPRLSLDSRAVFDAKGSIYPREICTNTSLLDGNRCETSKKGDESDKQRRSPSVIARLMGLEPTPNLNPEPVNKPELRRSASESRVSKDFYQCRFVDGNGLHLNQSQQANSQRNVIINNAANMLHFSNARLPDRKDFASRNVKTESVKAAHRGIGQRKGFFDSSEVFPEPTKQNVTNCGEIEKRLKLRGIDEPTRDLETLKQILEALQLKGLLHSSRSSKQIVNRNYGYNRRFSQSESPIVVMKPARSPAWMNCSEKISTESPPSLRSRSGARQNVNLATENFPAMRPRHQQSEIHWNVRNQNRGRSPSSPTRSESSLKSLSRRGQSSIETQRRGSGPGDHSRVTPVQSPKISSRKTSSNPQTTNRTGRNRKPGAEIYPKEEDELSSTVSETSISASSQHETERCPTVEEYKEGRSLLERCDKLLNSIAEITATELQPSPVSVLDSSIYKDESSPSPVLKRQIDFSDQPVEVEDDDIWNIQARFPEGKLNDNDYVFDILRASINLPGDVNVFLLLERQQHLKGRDTSKVSKLHRKLIFDTVNEILDRNREFPPWKSISWPKCAAAEFSFQQIWLEFQKIRERDGSEDLLEVICGVLRKDLARDAITGWGNWPIEMSEIVLDIERLIFKDLISETILDLAAFSSKCNSNNDPHFSRKKLMF